MEKMKAPKVVGMFFTVLAIAFLIALFISTCITLGIGQDALPVMEIRNDLIFAVFIALVQLIWIGSDSSNKTYIMRTVFHFIILLTGCTLLMMWFGWLPPTPYLLSYYISFIVAYIIIWLMFWRINKKKWKDMNEKLEAFKKANK